MRIKFCGAAEGVTGSCHLVELESTKFLLDCGMFQGSKTIEAKNGERFPFNASELDFMFLSHAHIDHCGRIPLLVKAGFHKPIYCTDATADLVGVMLRDSAYIQQRETEYKNKKAERLGRALTEPIYTIEDVEEALKYVTPVLYDSEKQINENVKVCFREAGHILGSAIIELWIEENGNSTKLVFSGDIGVQNRPILRDPTFIKKADIVVMETTYGNRLHPQNSKGIADLADAVKKTIKRGGTVIIPSFAVGRTQDVIYDFNQLMKSDSEFASIMENINVYVDSPMAQAATELFKKNAQVFDEESRNLILSGDNPINFKNLTFVKSVEESQALNSNRSPKVIISASGMCEAGRIKHHLKHNIWDPRNSVIFVGYQAEGTLGRLIVDGLKEVKILGEEIHVGAEIFDLKGFSAHADKNGLMEWLSSFEPAPKCTYLVHGDAQAKLDFAQAVKDELGFEPIPIMNYGTVDLADDVSPKLAAAGPNNAERLEQLRRMRYKLSDIHHGLEHILYTTELAADSKLTDEQLKDLNDILLQLEKSTLNLGSKVTDINEQNS